MKPQIKTINLRRLSSGDLLTLQVYQFLGKNLGKKTYLQANLHGAEIVGNVVITEIFDWLSQLDSSQLNGEIWLVPACNPVGMNQRSHFFNSGRYNSYDGKDWNRIFWDYDQENKNLEQFAKVHFADSPETIYQTYLQKIQQQFQGQLELTQQSSYLSYPAKYQQLLQSLCLDANYVIDIHSSSNQGVDYLFTFPGQEEQTKAFLLDVGLLVDEPTGYTFDEAFIKPWLSLENAFLKLGRKIKFEVASWTLELGSGMTANAESVKKGVRGIKNYLASLGIIQVSDFPLTETKTYPLQLVSKDRLKRYYAPTGGIIQNCADLKQAVVAGETIYQVLALNKPVEKPDLVNIKAENSGWIFDRATNQGVNEGEYVLTILEEEEKNNE